MHHLMRLIVQEQGIQHAEEALLLALLAVALFAAVTTLRGAIGNSLTNATGNMG